MFHFAIDILFKVGGVMAWGALPGDMLICYMFQTTSIIKFSTIAWKWKWHGAWGGGGALEDMFQTTSFIKFSTIAWKWKWHETWGGGGASQQLWGKWVNNNMVVNMVAQQSFYQLAVEPGGLLMA